MEREENVGELTLLYIVDLAAMHTKAAAGVRCDYALYAAGTPTNAASVLPASYNAQGLFIETEAKENSVIAWLSHIESWPTNSPIIIKASGRALASLLFGAVLNGRELHIRQVGRVKSVHSVICCELVPSILADACGVRAFVDFFFYC